MKIVRMMAILAAATLLVSCGTNEPAKKKPGQPTEVIGVDEKQSDKITFEAFPEATPTAVKSSLMSVLIPIKFATSTGTPNTIMVRFSGRGDGTVKLNSLKSPSSKLVRFTGVLVPTEQDDLDSSITAIVTKSMQLEVSCVGRLNPDANEGACFEVVASLVVLDAATNRSLIADQEKVFHFVTDFNSSTNTFGLVLNKSSTDGLRSQKVTGRDQAIKVLF